MSTQQTPSHELQPRDLIHISSLNTYRREWLDIDDQEPFPLRVVRVNADLVEPSRYVLITCEHLTRVNRCVLLRASREELFTILS